MKLRLIKIPGGLRPAFEQDEKYLARKKTGTMIEADVREPRNSALFRKWWVLVNFLAEHSDRFPTAEHASKYMLIQLGYCVWIPVSKVAPDRGGVPIADSISFASMDNAEFEAMYSKACDLLCEIIPHVTDENVKQVLAEFAGVGAMMER